MKLLLIGFDGLDYETFREYNSGYTVSPLRSLDPPRLATGPAWAALYFGTLPGTHGVTHEWGAEMEPIVESNGIVSKNHLTANGIAFWEILNKYGYTCELLNMPITYPVRPVNKWIVAGFLVIDPQHNQFTFPDKLRNRLPRKYIDHIDVAQATEALTKKNRENSKIEWMPKRRDKINYLSPDETFKQCKRNALYKLATFRRLHELNTDFGAIQYTIVDRMTHLHGIDNEEIRIPTYEFVLDMLKKTEEIIPADNYWIVSDHGTERRMHRINGVFAYKGIDMAPYKVSANIIDIAPTILFFYDIPPHIEQGTAHEGRVLIEVYKNYHKHIRDTEKQTILNQMKGLGYV